MKHLPPQSRAKGLRDHPRSGPGLSLTARFVLGCLALSCVPFWPVPARQRETRDGFTQENPSVGQELDGTRLAVLFRSSATPEERSASLHGTTSEACKPTGVGQWHVLELAEQDLMDEHQTDSHIRGLLGSNTIEFASPVYRGADHGWWAVTPDILIRFREGYAATGESLLSALAPGTDIVARNFGNMTGAFMIRSRHRNGFDVLAQAASLAQDPRVKWAEPDLLFTGRGLLVPNDPEYPNLWPANNTGQFGGVPGMDLGAEAAWDITTGSMSIKILVLDSGVQLNHPDLNIAGGADFTTDMGDGGPVNACDDHGTAVAGITSAFLGNALGTVGISPSSPVLSARTFISDLDCDGTWTSQSSWTVNALTWAESQGARVSNNSNAYSFSQQSQAIADKYASTRANGMVHFASAGNSASFSTSYPGSLSTVNAVSGLDETGELAYFSNYGTGISVSAPGTDVVTTDRTGADGYDNGDYGYFSGTSASSPYAAGVAALILSVEPSLSAAQVEAKLYCSARDMGGSDFDWYYGHGFVNAYRAVVGSIGTDTDGDGTDDPCDNCPAGPNSTQADDDRDGVGDVCDACPDDFRDDLDGDGRCADVDNCLAIANPTQADADSDGVGDACECRAASYTFTGIWHGDFAGQAAQGVGDMNDDGFDDVLVGEIGRGDFNFGRVRVFSGRDGSLLYDYTHGEINAWFGRAAAGLGDLNNDGFDDVLVGAPRDAIGRGRASVALGRPGPYPVPPEPPHIWLQGESPSDWFGWSVAGFGTDVNGDQVEDFVVGAYGNDGGGIDAGSVYVFSGAGGSLIYELAGAAAGDGFGFAVAAVGDVNADTIQDVAVGAPFNDAGGDGAGRVYIYSGPDGALIDTYTGEAPGDGFGTSVAAAGDVDGDGFDDVLVGAPGGAVGGMRTGRAYLYSGQLGTATYVFDGEEAEDEFGWTVTATGDANGDGFPEVAVGAPRHGDQGVPRAGQVYLYSTQTGALVDTIVGEALDDFFADSISGAADINADGNRDLIVGAWAHDSGGVDAGRAYVYAVGYVDGDMDGIRPACDNCSSTHNPSQANDDADLLGNGCDNCPSEDNQDQADGDGDDQGDVCDPCPLDAQNDGDGDGRCANQDNCPDVSNFSQTDTDMDGIGDACDACILDPQNDDDADGLCYGADNCPDDFNPVQVDPDGDGIGSVCDSCPEDNDPAENDSDDDGQADLCDCRPDDDRDREPDGVDRIDASKSGPTTIALTWSPAAGADAYSVTRGALSTVGPAAYGSCLVEGVQGVSFGDPAVPAAGDGFFYLVQAENYTCGLGTLGYDSTEQERDNSNPAACAGSNSDGYPLSEQSVYGTVLGGLADLASSDNAYEEITEELSGGSPANRYSRLEHRWTFQVAAGGQVTFHVECRRTVGDDDFAFEYSTNGGSTWTPIGHPSLPGFEQDIDLVTPLPAGLSGEVMIRLVDTDHTPGNQSLEKVTIDELFIRSVLLN